MKRKRSVKAMIWNFKERFPSDVLGVYNAFSIFDSEKVPNDYTHLTNLLSTKFVR